jgi:GNAT superfamily N-acetyltransferase
MNPTVDVIRTAELEDVAGVTVTLAEAFQDGDLAGWLIPDPDERRRTYTRYFRIFAEFFVAHGRVDTFDDLSAVALWWPVGEKLELDIPNYDDRLMHATDNAVGRFITLDMAMHANHPTHRAHEYLAFLAVQPERQGRGLGSALLRHRHAYLDRHGKSAYLEATGVRNRSLYEQHGYRRGPMFNIPAGPDLHPMWRAPGGQ